MRPIDPVRLTPGKRVLFLTKDPERIRAQLAGTLNLTMADVKVEDLLDDVNTDAMTPAWVCFRHRPEDLALDAYAGLVVAGKRLFPTRALMDGNFEVIVSGLRKGTGSSRETAVQAEKWSGIRIAIAASFAPINTPWLMLLRAWIGAKDAATARRMPDHFSACTAVSRDEPTPLR